MTFENVQGKGGVFSSDGDNLSSLRGERKKGNVSVHMDGKRKKRSNDLRKGEGSFAGNRRGFGIWIHIS